MQSQVYMLLSAAEMDADDRLFLPELFPEPRLSTPESGLYAQVRSGGETIWQSTSVSGLDLPQPLGPTIQMNSLSSIVKFTSARAII